MSQSAPYTFCETSKKAKQHLERALGVSTTGPNSRMPELC